MTVLASSIFVLILVAICSCQPSVQEECEIATSLAQNELQVATRFQPPENASPQGATSVPGCLVLRDNWWAYELCIGRWIRQFHEEKGAVVAEFFLGRAQHAFVNDFVGTYRVKYADGMRNIRRQLELAKLDSAVVQHYSCRSAVGAEDRAPHIVDTLYSSGTVCDQTKQPRVSQVVFVCEEAQFPVVFNMTETKTCSYKFHIVGPAVCEMMGLASPSHIQHTKPHIEPAQPNQGKPVEKVVTTVELPEELLLFAL